MATTKRPETRRVLRGASSRDEGRSAAEVLAAIPWDGHRERATLPAMAFLAAIRG